jgi:3-oxoacyl-[acyl-carrier-protein] synthase II
MQKIKRVVVTGLGSLTPIGNNTQTYWENLVRGTSGAAPITRFDASKHKTKFACELKNYREEDHFDRKEAKKLDPCSQYALIATKEAIEDARLELNKLDVERIGVLWGTGIGGIKSIQDEIVAFTQGGMVPRFGAFFITKMIANMPAGQISIKYGLKGPNYVAVSACASASNALISATHIIQLGVADVMVTGGSEAAVTPVAIGGFNVIRALSERNNDPTTASRPFDKHRDGFVLGEGAGALILESYEHALARGAHIYAEVLGAGMSGEAYHITAPRPDGQGAALVMKQALKSAGISPQEVGYINVHGTSTPLGDVSEVKAIQDIFQDHAYQLNISSTKSMTGHLLGAAGAIESIASILAIKHSLIPPTINHFELDDALDNNLNFTFNKAQHRELSVVLNNSFGFGGHNTCVVFKKWTN